MGRQSTIKRLPPSVRERIVALRDAGHTIDEILAHLATMEARVSRSALGRHLKQLDAIGKEIRRSREIAEALVKEYGAAPPKRTARMNIEVMHSLMSRILFTEQGDVMEISSAEAMQLSRALKDLSQASRHDIAAQVEVRKHFAEKAADAAADAASRVGGGRLTPEQLTTIREQVYGVFDLDMQRGASTS